MSTNPEGRKILVSGASGYVGGRLVRALLDDGLDVRIFIRNSAKIQGQHGQKDRHHHRYEDHERPLGFQKWFLVFTRHRFAHELGGFFRPL